MVSYEGIVKPGTIIMSFTKQISETENLKATCMQLDPKKMIEAMAQAMACMYNTQKGPSQKSTGTKPTGGNPYLRKSKPSEIIKGLDGTTNPSLMCHCCKGSGHELDNCSKLQ